MALDNAQFISELSITDPVGTDPLSEGDNQIRTSKRTQQQSLPLLDAVVNKSSAQLNDVAQKSEANIFSDVNTFNANVTFGARLRAIDGSPGNPTYSFTSDNSSGMYLAATSDLGLVVNSASKFRVQDTRLLSQVRHEFNAAGTQFFAFANIVQKTSDTGVAGFVYNDFAGIGRWLLGQSTAANGERFTLQRRDSGGNVLDSPWEVLNTDGHVQMLQMNMIRNPDTQGTAMAWKTAGTVTRWSLNFEGTSGFNPNSLTFTAFNSSGTFQNNPFRLGPNGTLFMEALPTVNPGVAGQLWRNPVSPGFVAIV